MLSNIEKKKKRWLDIAVAFGLFLAALAPFVKVLLRPNHIAYGFRELTIDMNFFYFSEALIREGWALGELPLWNPYVGGGEPGLAQPQTAALYLPTILLRWLPLPAFLNWGGILHVWLGGLGMFVLLREMKVGRAAATLSAVSYMFSGVVSPRFLAGHPDHVYLTTWPAWVLVCYRRLLHRGSWWHFVLTVALTVLEILTGHLHSVAIALLIPVGYFLLFAVQQVRAHHWRRLGYGLAVSALAAFLAIGLAAAQLTPTIELLQHSERVSHGGISFEQASAPAVSALGLWDLGTVAMPFLLFDISTMAPLGGFAFFFEMSPYAGLLTLGLAAVSLFTRDEELRPLTRYFAVLGTIGLLLALRSSPLYYLVHTFIPLIRFSGRFSALWVFSVASLGGLGLEAVIRSLGEPNRPIVARWWRWAGVIVVTMIALTLGAILFCTQLIVLLQATGHFYWLDPSTIVNLERRNLCWLLITLTMALVWIGSRKLLPVRKWAWLIVGGLLIEMYLFSWPLIVPQDREELYSPSNPMAIIDTDPSEVRVLDPLSPLYQVPHAGYILGSGLEVSTLEDLLQLGMGDARGAQLLAAGYFFSTEAVSAPEVEEIQHIGDAYLYGYTNRWPRIYAAPTVHVVVVEADALAFVADEAFNPFEVAVVIASDEAPNLPPPPSTEIAEVTAEFTEYELNSFRARVVTDRPVMVVFSETYYPGWEARVDGEPATIWQANYAFRGVVIDPGEHFIDMDFHPASFRLGLGISGATLTLMMLVSAWVVVRQHFLARETMSNLISLVERTQRS